MNSINLIFGVHCHQPVGNFDHVIENVYQQSYQPFLQTIKNHPLIKLVFHISGPLLLWLKKNHPDFLTLTADLVKKGQIEILSGGFYEPILCVIPESDRLQQIKKMTEFIENELGYPSKGLWLAERIWEPHLPKSLVQAGINYTLVDDFHLKSIGLTEDETLGYYFTDEDGSVLNIFPINENLRYSIPFRLPQTTIDFLAAKANTAGNNLAVIVDDGEKFGSWPGTHKWVYEEGWLENFFKALEENSSWIKTTTFSQYLQNHKPRGRIYLSTASYFEMGEWSLPFAGGIAYQKIVSELKEKNSFEKYKLFLKGGFWRNFLAKYDESNHMHKRMLYVSEKITKVVHQKLEIAYDELLKSQCNCAYWHGIFGGLYLPHLRQAIYKHLINAENILDAAKKNSRLEIEETDFDKDNLLEVIINHPALRLFFDPDYGGSLFELDLKANSFNLINTLMRRREVYHEQMKQQTSPNDSQNSSNEETKSIHDINKARGKELINFLHYDWHRRVCLLDHFFDENISLDNLKKSDFLELGDFVNQPYQHQVRKNKTGVKLIFEREGGIYRNSVKFPIKIKKQISLTNKDDAFTVSYFIENLSNEKISANFGVEFNISFSSPDLTESFEKNIDNLTLRDTLNQFTINFLFSKNCLLYRFPIQTVSQSEQGFDLTYQGSTVIPTWLISLLPKEKFTVDMEIGIAKTL
jgi:alpha-amylase